jgi:predicted metallopeptidase
LNRRFKLKTKSKRIEWDNALDVKKSILNLIKRLDLNWLKKDRIFCFRSKSANTRAIARIWGFSKVWQKALKEEPAYIIEVISERFDKLDNREKDKVLLHEIAHIPLNFSGSLVPHIRKGKRNFKSKVDLLVRKYFSRKIEA